MLLKVAKDRSSDGPSRLWPQAKNIMATVIKLY